jgi:S-adenosylmethionine:tRNA ribosyltransferase-isomerase
MKISDFDYELPEELIAQRPLADRDASRMLIVDRATQTWRDSAFKALPDLLSAGDVLVINNTRVFPARLHGNRKPSGGAVELLLLREMEPNVWEALTRPAKRLQTGAELEFADGAMQAEVIDEAPNGVRLIKFASREPIAEVIDRIGEAPLPPYIKRPTAELEADRARYQTIYAKDRGAIAAPTAGLHFTPDVFNQIKDRGIQVAEVTLHVGYGTFEPVRVADTAEHRVAAEWFSVSEDAATTINEARARGFRAVAVGTTTTRTLESASANQQVVAQSGFASLTIVPGYQFKAVDALLTNFHLPQSSLLMLVCAFAGREFALAAYRHAVEERYRFYSYGDCMLIT